MKHLLFSSVLLLNLISLLSFSQARSSIVPLPQPALSSFKINTTSKNDRSCSYTVRITTSCSSPVYTRDQISLSFGDAYGNQVYAPRLDDPSTRTFERCSADTFTVYGPCTYPICYLYLYRRGYDGWMPEYVRVYGSSTVTFYYKTYIPSDLWYGFNYCNGVTSSATPAVSVQ
ncbi:hypothetical protein DCAR_0729316 [Daucus carota subsp. sativus]|nr:hypothetical protein DCAR_0729316 [Daucus carota subsp. sativus]